MANQNPLSATYRKRCPRWHARKASLEEHRTWVSIGQRSSQFGVKWKKRSRNLKQRLHLAIKPGPAKSWATCFFLWLTSRASSMSKPRMFWPRPSTALRAGFNTLKQSYAKLTKVWTNRHSKRWIDSGKKPRSWKLRKKNRYEHRAAPHRLSRCRHLRRCFIAAFHRALAMHDPSGHAPRRGLPTLVRPLDNRDQQSGHGPGSAQRA